ncbi:54S ribosomal protein L8, mitochondrial [Entomophthora muscae]|uniref:54S ribosomal protein L8, mitochondrial n=1 Tax=Entomophthora muscae TaxID=34485 RepID=A0ACC2TL45_9FUNG|nr:54S ribosomal protein L8, mitochondrial [Entomophthora muscae]
MYHGKHLKKFRGKTGQHRDDMLKNLVTSLIKYGRIETTWVKAKSMQRLAEKMVTHVKNDTSISNGICKEFVREHEITLPKLSELADRFKDRQGGYTRVFKNGNRPKDNAPMGIIEFVGEKYDLRTFLVTRAEARRRLEKDNLGFKTLDEIHEFLKTCETKGSPLQKSEFLRLKSQQKAMRDFERRIEKVKASQNYDSEAWEKAVQAEMELLTQKTKALKLTESS